MAGEWPRTNPALAGCRAALIGDVLIISLLDQKQTAFQGISLLETPHIFVIFSIFNMLEGVNSEEPLTAHA
jgi:hypothetical protein